MVEKGKLYIVATPIGNLKDITLRAIEILKEVDVILAEDTRRAKKLLNTYDIKTKVIHYSLVNERKLTDKVVIKIKKGLNIALISDSGTPGISDPGFLLVREAVKKGIEVIPIPGVSALTTIVSISHIPLNRFLFIGYLPRKEKKLKKLKKVLKNMDFPVIFFITPHRYQKELSFILESLGNREVILGRELTKKYEEVIRTTLKRIKEKFDKSPPKGEMVLAIDTIQSEKKENLNIDVKKREKIKKSILFYLRNSDLTLKEILNRIKKDFGVSKKVAYKIYLEDIKEKEGSG